MIVIGLTGSIGMGKSTVGRLLEHLGVPVHESDISAHRALEPDSHIFEDLKKYFPEAYVKKHNVIDRKKLGEVVFSDPHKKAYLESLVHPIVQDSQNDFTHAMSAKGKKMAVLDIPLLYETGAQERVDKVVVVTAPFFIQTQRVLARPNMTVEKFNAILRSQMPDAQKRLHADYVVQTGLGMARTQRQVRAMLKDIQH